LLTANSSRRNTHSCRVVCPRRYDFSFCVHDYGRVLTDHLKSTAGLAHDLQWILKGIENCTWRDANAFPTNRLFDSVPGIPSDLLWQTRTRGFLSR
jgi:hypothetical protein